MKKQIWSVVAIVVMAFLALGSTSSPGPSDPQTAEPSGQQTTESESASSNDSSVSRGSASSQPSSSEVDRVFAERTREYERQLKSWNEAKDSRSADKIEQVELQSQIRSLDLKKPTPPELQAREWSTFDKGKLDAVLVETDNVNVTLRKSDGTDVSVTKKEFVAGDRIYIENSFLAIEKWRKNLEKWEAQKQAITDELASVSKRIDEPEQMKPTMQSRQEVRDELAAAKSKKEKEKKLAEAKAKQDAAAAVEKRAQDEIDAYAAILRAVDPEGIIVAKVSSKGDKLIITVNNVWHYQPYQVRLQASQNLWEGWANLHSPKEPDKARISIVDLNGNEVGGSRFLGGSLIWVQKK